MSHEAELTVLGIAFLVALLFAIAQSQRIPTKRSSARDTTLRF